MKTDYDKGTAGFSLHLKLEVFTPSVNCFTNSNALYMCVKHHKRVNILRYGDFFLPLQAKAFKRKP